MSYDDFADRLDLLDQVGGECDVCGRLLDHHGADLGSPVDDDSVIGIPDGVEGSHDQQGRRRFICAGHGAFYALDLRPWTLDL